jgi:hypothetical protein
MILNSVILSEVKEPLISAFAHWKNTRAVSLEKIKSPSTSLRMTI